MDDVESSDETINFMDMSESSDSYQEDNKIETNSITRNPIQNDTGRTKLEYLFINIKTYNFKKWSEYFPNNKVDIRYLIFNKDWSEFFDQIENKPYISVINNILSECIADKTILVPDAELVFNSLNVISPKDIKVIFIGQDPYIRLQEIDGKIIPQAIGLSFSLPIGYSKTPSLDNIYKNLIKFKHIKRIPNYGCLATWAIQGCFFLNAALTTVSGKSNAHKSIWEEFTKDIITYLSNKFQNLIFIAWGLNAHYIVLNVNPKQHLILTSSHPSPYSFSNNFQGWTYEPNKILNLRKRVTYPSFSSFDHFGKINEHLKKNNKMPILWDIID